LSNFKDNKRVNNRTGRKRTQKFVFDFASAFLYNNSGDDKNMQETKYLEFKEEITNTFLKTVSAFANYGTGKIIFGIDDQGKIKGLSDLKEACLNIENKINDSISPNPDFTLKIDEAKATITLEVKEGMNKPYFYKGKVYKRNDTSTIEVDGIELKRLVLESQNINFEELKSKEQSLTFNY